MLAGFGFLSRLVDLGPFGDYARIAVRGASHRAELASIELAEAKAEAVAALALLGCTSVLAVLFGVAATLLVAAAVWDGPHRVLALAGLAGGYLLAALTVGLLLRRRLAAWKPFAATADQLRKDTQCLEKIVRSQSEA